MAAPSLRTAGVVVVDNNGDGINAYDPPPTHVAGDIFIAVMASSANGSVTPAHTTPTGWTLIGSAVNTTGTTRTRISAFWKRAASASDSGIASATSTPTGSAASHHFLTIHVFQGCKSTGTPYEGLNTNEAAGASALALTRGATAADRLSFIATHHGSNTGTAASENHADAYTQRTFSDSASGITGSTFIADFTPVDDNESLTVTYAGGGTAVGISGLAFALLPDTVDLTVSGSGDVVLGAGGVPEVDQLLSGAAALSFGAAGAPEQDVALSGALALTFGAAGEPMPDLALSGRPRVTLGAEGEPENLMPVYADRWAAHLWSRGLIGLGKRVVGYVLVPPIPKPPPPPAVDVFHDLAGSQGFALGAAGDPPAPADTFLTGAPGLAFGAGGSPDPAPGDVYLTGAPGLALAGAGAPAAEAAASFYVSTTGNDANAGTFSAPWRTIQKAMNSATPGSTVHIRGGTYEEVLVMGVSGTAGLPIVFQNYGYTVTAGGVKGGTIPGEQVVVDLTFRGDVTTGQRFMQINNRSYVEIRGIKWTHDRAHAAGPARGFWIEGTSSYVTVRDCKFIDNKDTGAYGASAYAHFRIMPSGNNVTVYGCEFGDLRTNLSEPCTASGSTVNNITIENNYFHDTDNLCVDIHNGANNVTVRGNLIEYIGWTRAEALYYAGKNTNAMYCDGGNTVVFENNTVRKCSWGVAVMSEPSLPNSFAVTIRNNVFFACGNGSSAAIALGTWYSGKSDTGVYIYNNTVVNSVRGTSNATYAIANTFVQNNIIAFNTTNVNGTPHGSWDYNCFFSGGTYTGDANRLDADPLLVNRAAEDLHLTPSSPCVNRGNPTYDSARSGTTDKDGAARLQGGRIDIGAYEEA